MRYKVILLLFFFSPIAHSLEVLGVVGPVEDAQPHYARLIQSGLPGKDIRLVPSEMARARTWSGLMPYDSQLPQKAFRPTALSPQATEALLLPICLIANDPPSLDWLRRVKTILKQTKAVCYLVRTKVPGDIQHIRSVIPGIPLVALNPLMVIEKFKVPGYPALISKRGIEQ